MLMTAGGTLTSIRVDKWLWSVRLYRTRTAATDACAAGRVTVNGEDAKPATRVGIGDTVAARLRGRSVVYVVTGVVAKRVSAREAAGCFDDVSPPQPERTMAAAPPGGMRDRGAGRPTKRDRRRIDQLRGR